MKNVFTLLLFLALSLASIAQAPETMTYQAVVRNTDNSLVSNSPIGIKVNILQGGIDGVSKYAESHTVSTNSNGLLDIEIGNGTAISGTYSGINWSEGQYYLKTEIDVDGGENYTITITSKLLSVPYANYSVYSGLSWNLSNPAMNFVGLYKATGVAAEDLGFILVTYLSPSEVIFVIRGTDGSTFVEFIGDIVGDSILLPTENLIYNIVSSTLQSGSGLKLNNTLTLNLIDPADPIPPLVFIKQ